MWRINAYKVTRFRTTPHTHYPESSSENDDPRDTAAFKWKFERGTSKGKRFPIKIHFNVTSLLVLQHIKNRTLFINSRGTVRIYNYCSDNFRHRYNENDRLAYCIFRNHKRDMERATILKNTRNFNRNKIKQTDITHKVKLRDVTQGLHH